MICKDFNSYLIYPDGKIYSTKTCKFLKPDCYGAYAQVTLSIEKKPVRYKVHRLVAYLFCNPPSNYYDLEVDHIDGNHFNNNADNLEWVTCAENNRRAREKGFNDVSASNSRRWKSQEFRERTSKNISSGQIKSGCFSGKKNPRYRFEIHGKDGKEYMMSELTTLTGKSLTWVYNKIVKFLGGMSIPEFTKCGIVSITDLKKVKSIDYRKL